MSYTIDPEVLNRTIDRTGDPVVENEQPSIGAMTRESIAETSTLSIPRSSLRGTPALMSSNSTGITNTTPFRYADMRSLDVSDDEVANSSLTDLTETYRSMLANARFNGTRFINRVPPLEVITPTRTPGVITAEEARRRSDLANSRRRLFGNQEQIADTGTIQDHVEMLNRRAEEAAALASWGPVLRTHIERGPFETVHPGIIGDQNIDADWNAITGTVDNSAIYNSTLNSTNSTSNWSNLGTAGYASTSYLTQSALLEFLKDKLSLKVETQWAGKNVEIKVALVLAETGEELLTDTDSVQINHDY